MGMTITEKILAKKGGVKTVAPGDITVVSVDCIAFNDIISYFLGDRELLKMSDPDKIVAVFDHMVPPPTARAAAEQEVGREFVKRFGIKRFHDMGRDQGILHSIIAENGYALPGTVLISNDSHACSSGVFNCAARAVGRPDMIYGVATGNAWFKVGETIRYELEGRLSRSVSMKDVFFQLAGQYGDHSNMNVEYGGSALPYLNISARQTLTTMSAELSADFAVFEPDDVMFDHLLTVKAAPYEAQYPDRDAQYHDRRVVDLGSIGPLVALPDAVINNTVKVEEAEGTPINRAFLGSCANGMLDDIRIAAEVMQGKLVAPGVRFVVSPASQNIYRQALRAGYIGTLVDAGAIVTSSTCGACGGFHSGVLGPNDVCITTSTRNFKGRMGDPNARIYMGSPATVAAAAIAGVITHPGNFLTGAAA